MVRTRGKRRTIANGEVKLAVSEYGQGQTLLFLNGVGATQATWKRIMRHLNGRYRIVTFDFRSHGKSTTSHQNTFERFLTDAAAVIDEFSGDQPILVGWSMGADLAVWYAAAHPGKVAGLFLIDGALPVNLVDDPDEMRQQLDTPAVKFAPLLLYLVGMGYRLSPDDLAALTIDVNTRREQILSAYAKLDCPVELVLAAKTAGNKGERAERKNAQWRSGGEHLANVYPMLPIQWLDNTHLLPFKEPAKLAAALDEFVRRTQASDLGASQRDAGLGGRPW